MAWNPPADQSGWQPANWQPANWQPDADAIPAALEAILISNATLLAMIMGVGGVAVTHEGGSFFAIFDREFALSLDVETRTPALNARTCDVLTLAKDAVIAVSGEQFRVKRHEPDGTGMTVVVLRR